MRVMFYSLMAQLLFLVSCSAGFCEIGPDERVVANSAEIQSTKNGAVAHKHPDPPASDSGGEFPTDIGIDEKLGLTVPLDLPFHDDTGREVTLIQVITKPTVVALVFFSCRSTCPMLLGGLSNTLGKLGLDPKKDFTPIAISFDPRDTPQIAAEAKVNYVEAIGKPFPEEAWPFLTGSKESIKDFTDAVGFKFREDRGAFTHPVALIVLSPKGKITRYLYGMSFLPFDLAMALREASEEREGLRMNRVLLYCFSYDPEANKYVFNVLRVVGIVTLIFVVSLFVFLVISTKRSKNRRTDGGPIGRAP